MKLTILIRRSLTLRTWLHAVRGKLSPRKVCQPTGVALDFAMRPIIASKNSRLSSLDARRCRVRPFCSPGDTGFSGRGRREAANRRARSAARPPAVEYLGPRWLAPALLLNTASRPSSVSCLRARQTVDRLVPSAWMIRPSLQPALASDTFKKDDRCSRGD